MEASIPTTPARHISIETYFVAQRAFDDYNLATLRQAFEASDYDINRCDVYKKLIRRDMSSGTEDIIDYVHD